MPMSTYYERNKDKVLAYHRKRRAEMTAEQKTKLAEQKRVDNLRRRYNLTPKQVEDMLDAQQSNCAICSSSLTEYHIDHCHTTGKVRGLLCVNCNRGLGGFNDNLQNMKKAMEYLQACP